MNDLSSKKPRFIPGLNLPRKAFVPVFMYPEYEVNIDGDVRSVKTKKLKTKIVCEYPNGRQYYQIDLWRHNKAYRTGLHRILALTFLSTSYDTKHLVVNHLNGDSLDNRLDNLELTDHSGNLDHAFDHGLRSDHCEVECKSVSTGEIFQFRSWGHLSKFLGCSTPSVHYWATRHGIEYPYVGFYVKPADCASEWPDRPKYIKSRNAIGFVTVTNKEHPDRRMTVIQASKLLKVDRRVLADTVRNQMDFICGDTVVNNFKSTVTEM